MKILKILFAALYKVWFYVLLISYILVFLPFILFSIIKKDWYPFFFWLARRWSFYILFGMGLKPIVKKEAILEKGKSYMLIANHTSMIDIMLMLYVIKNPFVFVGKSELAKIPVFGFFYKRTCILVDRKNFKSRMAVYQSANEKLSKGYSVCIFPEGGVPDDERIVLDDFKDGAFRLAIDHKIPIVPMTFHDCKKRLPYSFKGGPGKLRVVVHPIIPTQILEPEDRRTLKYEVRDIILNELKKPSI